MAESLGRDRSTHPGWIPELDGFRALACLAVIIAHFNPGWPVPTGWSAASLSRGVAAVSGANLGVVFFYTLSAFLLTYLAVREYARSGRFDVKRFYVRRCLRIWPLYFTVLAVALAIVAAQADPLDERGPWTWTKTHLWLFFGFMSNWSLALNHVGAYVDQSTPPLAVLWSIAVEEQFYFVYPLLMLLALGSRVRDRGLIIVLVGAALACRTMFLHLPVTNPSLGPTGGMYYATTTYLDVFAAGATAGWLAAQGSESRATQFLTRRWVGPLLGAAIVVVGVAWVERFWYPYSSSTVVLYGVTGILFAALLLWATSNRESAACRVLRSRLLRALGVLSFGMYMWHPVSGILTNLNLGPMGPVDAMDLELKTAVSFGLYILITVGLAAMTYGLIERPFLNLKARVAAGQPVPPGLGDGRGTLAWGWFAVAMVAGTLLIETALFAGFAGVARSRVGWLVPLGPLPPIAGATNMPTARHLAERLGARVEAAPGEVNQYLIRGKPGSVDLSTLGTIHTDLGYAVGVTLPTGVQIGFRYEPVPLPGPPTLR